MSRREEDAFRVVSGLAIIGGLIAVIAFALTAPLSMI
jgi:hypothetical protein